MFGLQGLASFAASAVVVLANGPIVPQIAGLGARARRLDAAALNNRAGHHLLLVRSPADGIGLIAAAAAPPESRDQAIGIGPTG